MVYKNDGKTKTLVSFFKLLSQYFPKVPNTNQYSRSLNWGEFIHFSNGAVGTSMKEQAEKAFGWTSQMEKEYNKAKLDFSKIKYS